VDISNEEMLMLQRVTATKISDMCKVYEKEFVLSDLISILKHRSTDEQDQIRVLAVESFKEVARILTRDENKTYIMPLIIQAAEDKSWRVRLCLARNFADIAGNFGKEVTDMSLIQTYGNLLKDSEVDVKIEAVKSLSNFIKIVSAEKVGYLLPQVIALGKDSLAIVRGIDWFTQRA
jgi:serine/threonine-protein phosphatase 2A regulatory subunit A